MAREADAQGARLLPGEDDPCSEARLLTGEFPSSARSRAVRAAWVLLVCVAAGALASSAVASGARGAGEAPKATRQPSAMEAKSEQKSHASGKQAESDSRQLLIERAKVLLEAKMAAAKKEDAAETQLTEQTGELGSIAAKFGCEGPSSCAWANTKSCKGDADDGSPCWLMCCAQMTKPCSVTEQQLAKIRDMIDNEWLDSVIERRKLLDGPVPDTFKPCELAAALGGSGAVALPRTESEDEVGDEDKPEESEDEVGGEDEPEESEDEVEDEAEPEVQCTDCSWSHIKDACLPKHADGSVCWEICCRLARSMLIVSTTSTPPPRPPLELPPMFGSHMVLPAGVSFKMYGWANPDSGSVVVKHGGNDYYANADHGTWYWEVMLPPAGVSAVPAKIVVSTEADSITLTDVLFGELYMCVGASNIDFRLDWSTDASRALKDTKKYGDRVRIIKTKKQEGKKPSQNFKAQFEWQRARNDNNTAEFSALCYFFGLEQINRRADTPVGLIQASWGATASWQWAPRQALVDCECLVDENAGHGDFWEPRSSSVLWYGMMSPWTALDVKGLVINLQGDNCILPFMLRHWRQGWMERGNKGPAVVAAQFGCNTGEGGDPAEVNDARIDQMHFLEADRTALAVTSDFCDPASPYAIMHSPFKREEAARLAEAAESVTQGGADLPGAFPVPIAVYADPWDESWGAPGAGGGDECEARSWGIRVEFDQDLAVKPEFQALHSKFPHINGFTLYPAVESRGWDAPTKLAVTEVRGNVVVLNTTLFMSELGATYPWPGALIYGEGAFPVLPLTDRAGQPVGSFKMDVPQEPHRPGPYSLFTRGEWSPGRRW